MKAEGFLEELEVCVVRNAEDDEVAFHNRLQFLDERSVSREICGFNLAEYRKEFRTAHPHTCVALLGDDLAESTTDLFLHELSACLLFLEVLKLCGGGITAVCSRRLQVFLHPG